MAEKTTRDGTPTASVEENLVSAHASLWDARYRLHSRTLSIDLAASRLPFGFRKMDHYGLISDESFSLITSVNERVQQQLRSYHANGLLPREADATWSTLELRIHRQSFGNGAGILDRWLRWGMIAYIYQCYSYDHRRTFGQKVLEGLNELVRRTQDESKFEAREFAGELCEDERRRHLRDCAVWVLMCLAAASARRQKDEGATDPGLEGPMDRASLTLMDRIRTLFDFDTNESTDLDLEWESVEEVVTQFWCPLWMLREWEMMWKDESGHAVRAAAYYRVYHHWHSAILPEDIGIG